MTRIAFYAPLKAPNHPNPSGDRYMARGLMQAIGDDVFLVSELRSYDGKGDEAVQNARLAQADDEVNRISSELEENHVSCWITYHNYYKAPDLIGPKVCEALGLPYVQIETSRARSRLHGPWAQYAAAAEAASDQADVIFYMTKLDQETLERDRPAHQKLIHLPPFLAQDSLPPAAPLRGNTILAAGMMRPGDKLASYTLIAETLPHLRGDWRLNIAGDGQARSEVNALFAPFGDRVQFLGQLDSAAMAQAYRSADLFFWPGVNEAYGMVYLEAQAAGLPVVAQDRPGVRDVLMPGDYPTPDAGPAAMAKRIDALLSEPELRTQQASAARSHIRTHHLLGAARQTIWDALTPLIGANK